MLFIFLYIMSADIYLKDSLTAQRKLNKTKILYKYLLKL